MLANKHGLLLWDIDGTLLQRKRSNRSSVHLEALGISESLHLEKDLSGLTDWDVLRTIACIYDLPDYSVKSAFQKLDVLEPRRGLNNFERCVGIEDQLFEYLSTSWMHGILSGNTFERARMKLKSVNLLHYFESEFFFCCELYESRINIARRAALSLHKREIYSVVIGDTQHDIRSAKSVGIPSVAVASGTSSLESLKSVSPDLLLGKIESNYEDFDKKLQSIIKRNSP